MEMTVGHDTWERWEAAEFAALNWAELPCKPIKFIASGRNPVKICHIFAQVRLKAPMCNDSLT